MVFFPASGDDPKGHPSQAADAEAERLSAEEDSDITGVEEQVLKKTPDKPKKDESASSSGARAVLPRVSRGKKDDYCNDQFNVIKPYQL